MTKKFDQLYKVRSALPSGGFAPHRRRHRQRLTLHHDPVELAATSLVCWASMVCRMSRLGVIPVGSLLALAVARFGVVRPTLATTTAC
jgi:hypothetical protein